VEIPGEKRELVAQAVAPTTNSAFHNLERFGLMSYVRVMKSISSGQRFLKALVMPARLE
jgi:hypothetical protein